MHRFESQQCSQHVLGIGSNTWQTQIVQLSRRDLHTQTTVPGCPGLCVKAGHDCTGQPHLGTHHTWPISTHGPGARLSTSWGLQS